MDANVTLLWLSAGPNNFLLGVFSEPQVAIDQAQRQYDFYTRDGGLLYVEKQVPVLQAAFALPAERKTYGERIEVRRPRAPKGTLQDIGERTAPLA